MMAVQVFYSLICVMCYLEVIRSFNDDIMQPQITRKISKRLVSKVAKKLLRNNSTDVVFPDDSFNLDQLTNDQLHQAIMKFTEIGVNLKDQEKVLKVIEEADKITETQATDSHKFNGKTMGRNSSLNESEITEYDYDYENESDDNQNLFVCSNELCNFRGNCWVTKSDLTFCACNDWAFGSNCQINAAGVIIGFVILIFVLLLIMTGILAFRYYLKYKKWQTSKNMIPDQFLHDNDNNGDKLEMSKLQFH